MNTVSVVTYTVLDTVRNKNSLLQSILLEYSISLRSGLKHNSVHAILRDTSCIDELPKAFCMAGILASVNYLRCLIVRKRLHVFPDSDYCRTSPFMS